MGMRAEMWQLRERVVKKWGDQTQAPLSMNFAGMRRGEMEKSQRMFLCLYGYANDAMGVDGAREVGNH